MVSNKSSINLICAALVTAASLVVACAPLRGPAPVEPAAEAPPTPSAPPPALEEKQARSSAATALVQQGRELLDKGDADAALRVLGQAANLNPSDGELYFYMAQAWLMKQNASQARDYNRLAETYLGRDPQWIRRIARQSDRIEELQQ